MVTYIFGTTVLLASAIFSCGLLLLVFLLLLSISRANSEQLYLTAATWRLLGWNMLLNVSFTFYFNFTTYKGRLICQFYEAQVMDWGYLFIFKSYPTSFEDGPLSKWSGIIGFIESAVALCFNSPKYLLKWRRQLRRHHNRPHKFWERLHWLIGTFPFYTRYLFEKVS